jgi:hypothetical protein
VIRVRVRHVVIAGGLGVCSFLLYALGNIWKSPQWMVAAVAAVGGVFAALAFLYPVDPRATAKPADVVPTRPAEPAPPVGGAAKPGDVPSFDLARALGRLLVAVLVAPLLGVVVAIPMTVGAGFGYARAADMGMIDIVQYEFSFGLLFKLPVFLIAAMVFGARETGARVAGVLLWLFLSVLYVIGYLFHDRLGIVGDVGESVARWFAG